MKPVQPIATWSFAPIIHNKVENDKMKLNHLLACTKASIESFNKYYSRPIIYTDTLGKEVFSILTKDADYVVLYDDIHHTNVGSMTAESCPIEFWSYAKMLSYKEQTKPFVHFDLDFIARTNLQKDTDLSVVVQCSETVKPSNSAYVNESNKKDYILPEVFHKYNVEEVQSVNAGYLLISDMDFNKVYADTAIKLLKDNIINLEKMPNNLFPNCTAEQQVLGLLMKEYNIKYSTLIRETDRCVNPLFEHYTYQIKDTPKIARRMQSLVAQVPLIDELTAYVNSRRTA